MRQYSPWETTPIRHDELSRKRWELRRGLLQIDVKLSGLTEKPSAVFERQLLDTTSRGRLADMSEQHGPGHGHEVSIRRGLSVAVWTSKAPVVVQCDVRGAGDNCGEQGFVPD